MTALCINNLNKNICPSYESAFKNIPFEARKLINNEHSVRHSPPLEGLGEVLTFLGTGTSNGVPVLGCNCEVCKRKDPRNNRLRTAALLETAKTRIVIDCGPDFRQQMLPRPFRKIDGLLVTHIHYDHVGGIDDVRPYCALGNIDVYANANTCNGLRHNSLIVSRKIPAQEYQN